MKKFQFLSLCLLFFIINFKSTTASELSEEEEKDDIIEQEASMQMSLESLFSQATNPRKRPHPSKEVLKTYKIYNYHRDSKDRDFFIGKLHDDCVFFMNLLSNNELYKRFLSEVDKPLHYLLLYGSSGSGKKTLAHQIAQKSRLKLYELDYNMAPLKVQINKLMTDLKSLSENAIRGNEKKILLFSGLHPQIPLNDLAENEDLKEILDHFFIIVTTDIDIQSYDDMSLIEELDISFTVQVPKAKLEERVLIIKSMLKNKSHSLTEGEIYQWAKSFSNFNGHHLKKIINKATINSIKNNSNITLKDLEKAHKFTLTKGLAPSYQSLYL